MPGQLATNFYDTFTNWQLGNEGIVRSFQSVLDLDLETLQSQQNNPYCK